MIIEAEKRRRGNAVEGRHTGPDFRVRRSVASLEVAALSPRGLSWLSGKRASGDDENRAVFSSDVAFANVLLRDAIQEGLVTQYVGPNETIIF